MMRPQRMLQRRLWRVVLEAEHPAPRESPPSPRSQTCPPHAPPRATWAARSGTRKKERHFPAHLVEWWWLAPRRAGWLSQWRARWCRSSKPSCPHSRRPVQWWLYPGSADQGWEGSTHEHLSDQWRWESLKCLQAFGHLFKWSVFSLLSI